MNDNEPTSQSTSRITELDVHIRVRYCECDPMNVAHHSVYAVWLEIGRTELLRARGVAYKDLEAQGVLFVVVRMNFRFRKPANYDDLLTIRVRATGSGGVKLEHEYEVRRGDEILATAETTLACVNRAGKLQPIPEHMLG